MKRNLAPLGLILGLILPALGVVIMYLINFRDAGFGNYLSNILNNGKFGFMVLSLSLLLNIIPFIYYNSKRYDLTSRGVFIATMLYAVFMVLLRYVWS